MRYLTRGVFRRHIALAGFLFVSCSDGSDAPLAPFPALPAPEAVQDSLLEWVPPARQPGPAREAVARRLPDPRAGGSGYCAPREVDDVDVPSWTQGADDVIVGTLQDFRPAWEPLWNSAAPMTVFLDPRDCLEGDPGLDLYLVEVESLLGHDVPNELVVRVGYGTFYLWGNSPLVDVGSDVVKGWTLDTIGDPPPAPPLETGLRIGGALYWHAAIDAPVFVPYHEPLFEVVDGRTWFQRRRHRNPDCPVRWLDIAALDGLTVEELGEVLRNAAAWDFAPLASEHRSRLRVDLPADEAIGSYVFGARCRYRVGEEYPEERPYHCGTSSDCWPSDVCLGGACVPAGGGWDAPSDEQGDDPLDRPGPSD
jgi:hypothetical protein